VLFVSTKHQRSKDRTSSEEQPPRCDLVCQDFRRNSADSKLESIDLFLDKGEQETLDLAEALLPFSYLSLGSLDVDCARPSEPGEDGRYDAVSTKSFVSRLDSDTYRKFTTWSDSLKRLVLSGI
jgi:hypothetical protein